MLENIIEHRKYFKNKLLNKSIIKIIKLIKNKLTHLFFSQFQIFLTC